MNIVIVADNPSMGATYRLPAVFRSVGIEARSIVRQPDGFREWPVDLLSSDADAWPTLDAADVVLLIGTTAWKVVLGLCPDAAVYDWAKERRIVAWEVESFYPRHALEVQTNVYERIGLARHFAMPDLIPSVPRMMLPDGTYDPVVDAVPLLQPMVVADSVPAKSWPPLIVHSPGTHRKAEQKGTATIMGALDEVMRMGHRFRAKVLYYAPHIEVLSAKLGATIVIDQLPGDDQPYGLGNSGLEGLASGAVTITRSYNETLTKGYFRHPPILNADNQGHLVHQIDLVLRTLKDWSVAPLSDQCTVNPTWVDVRQAASIKWAQQHVSYRAWAEYFLNHAMPNEPFLHTASFLGTNQPDPVTFVDYPDADCRLPAL